VRAFVGAIKVTRSKFAAFVAVSLAVMSAGFIDALAQDKSPRRSPGTETRPPAQPTQAPPPAEGVGQLPGGATSLRETHGDWTVACASNAQAKLCGVSQQQTDSRSGQRVMAIEVGIPSNEGTRVTLVLPFGVLLEKGAVVQVDDAAASSPYAFKTCMPFGCIVEISLNREGIEAWRKGSVLKLKTVAVEGSRDVQFTVSLKGFPGAVDRATALVK
jgi:invasion protein IalB